MIINLQYENGKLFYLKQAADDFPSPFWDKEGIILCFSLNELLSECRSA
jgi:hypothetical protein